MELIERYIDAIGQKIWSKNRKDIEAELRTILYDSLDERSEGNEVTEKQVRELLIEFGSPSEVASRYNSPEKYLIGPNVYHLYCLVLKIVLPIVLIGLTIGIVISFATQSSENAGLFRLITIVPEYLTGVVTSFGYVTIIFFLVDRFGVNQEIKLDEKWNPDTLPKIVSEQDKVGKISCLVNLIMIVMALLLFNFYVDQISVFFHDGLEWTRYPAISKGALEGYLPFWNGVWVLSLMLNLMLLKMGRWYLVTKIFKAVLSLASIVILAMMIGGPELIDLSGISMIAEQTGQNLTAVFEILGKMLKVLYGFIIVMIIIDTVKDGYNYIRR